MITAKIQTDIAKKQLAVMRGEVESRQSRRHKQLETLENQVKELIYLLGVTTNALEKAATLMSVLSPDTAQRFSDVLRLVNDKKLKVLGKLD